MDPNRDSSKNLQCIVDATASHSATARDVIATYYDSLRALTRTVERLHQMGEERFAGAMETRVVDLELQARRHLEALHSRERCKHCNEWLDQCGPTAWDDGRKCCDGCTHHVVRRAPTWESIKVTLAEAADIPFTDITIPADKCARCNAAATFMNGAGTRYCDACGEKAGYSAAARALLQMVRP